MAQHHPVVGMLVVWYGSKHNLLENSKRGTCVCVNMRFTGAHLSNFTHQEVMSQIRLKHRADRQYFVTVYAETKTNVFLL